MDDDLVARLPAGHSLADLPDDPGGVGAADVVAVLGVVAIAEDRDRFTERRPDVVEVDPAAITLTTTSKAPGSGTSICSSWKASVGSPSRSWRITQAAIVSGRVPGSTSSCEIALLSTAKTVLRGRR
jgi:hypothetical protein